MMGSLRIIIFFMLFVPTYVFGQGNIIVTFKPFEKTMPHLQLEGLSIIDQPKKLPQTIIKKKLGVVSGIVGVLNGQMSISDTNGQMIFLRQMVGNSLNILITSNIKPIIFHGNTVHQWIIPDVENAQMYTAIRSQDPKTNEYAWQIAQTTLSANVAIPQNTLIIFGKPSDVVIPTGEYITRGDPHILLPNIFVKQGISAPGAYMRYLKHSRLYRQLKKVYKDDQTSVSSLITN